MIVSIHAPALGRDLSLCAMMEFGNMFQFTRPHWGATHARPRRGHPDRFNSRARTGARPKADALRDEWQMFQFTRPHWGATRLENGMPRMDGFNSRARTGARPDTGAPLVSADGFNSRARTGARRGAEDHGAARRVSIHAPALGRDGGAAMHTSACSSFNSRARTGARQVAQTHGQDRLVSIHAPALGRDANVSRRRAVSQRFQFTRPHWGATECHLTDALRLWFQFTRPHWGATAHGGGEGAFAVFQFTRPHWGATRDTRTRRCSRSFNSRARTGARPLRRRRGIRLHGFNSRARTGARRSQA